MAEITVDDILEAGSGRGMLPDQSQQGFQGQPMQLAQLGQPQMTQMQANADRLRQRLYSTLPSDEEMNNVRQRREAARQQMLDQIGQGNKALESARMWEGYFTPPRGTEMNPVSPDSYAIHGVSQAYRQNLENKAIAEQLRNKLATQFSEQDVGESVKDEAQALRDLVSLERSGMGRTGAGGAPNFAKMRQDATYQARQLLEKSGALRGLSEDQIMEAVQKRAAELFASYTQDLGLNPQQAFDAWKTAGGAQSQPTSTEVQRVPQGRDTSQPIPTREELARQKEALTGSEKVATKNFEEQIMPAANSAQGMLQTIQSIRAIPYEPGRFAEYKEKVGGVFDALGLDGKIVEQAKDYQQVRPMLQTLANQRLMAAKGVQTEGDAQRAFNEFAKITDTKQATDYILAWSEELARRNIARKNTFEAWADQHNGSYRGADKLWQETDMMNTAPVQVIGKKPIGYSAWAKAFEAKNPNATPRDAQNVWNSLGRK